MKFMASGSYTITGGFTLNGGALGDEVVLDRFGGSGTDRLGKTHNSRLRLVGNKGKGFGEFPDGFPQLSHPLAEFLDRGLCGG
jgi:hypothetical protein